MIANRPVKFVTMCGGLSMSQCRMKHILPTLPYKFNDLEPIISGEIMELHYLKHHGTYVNNLNNLEEQVTAAIESKEVNKLVELQKGIKFNGGGHINHSILWTNLCPPNSFKPASEELLSAINNAFGSFDNFKQTLSNMAVGIEGSGWAWLGLNPKTFTLQLEKCQNQDPLQPTTGLIPLLGFDVWEHAYYLQYKNVRAEYVKKIWEVINWNNVFKRYSAAMKLKKN